jgi:AraC-like DNA-binding protein
VDVVAHLPPILLAHLRRVLGERHTVWPVAGWADLAHAARRRPADVAVLDPAADGTPRIEEIVELVRRHPSLPILVYTTLSPQSMRAIVELSRHGIQQVLLYRFDDEPHRLLDALEQQPSMTLCTALMNRLARPLSLLPVALGREVERMYRQPREYGDASDLARAAGMSRRTMYRALEEAGIPSPGLLVRGARLLRAYAYLGDSGNSVEDVVVKLGYSSRQLFIRHVRDAFGAVPSELRRRLTPAECVERLARLLCGAPPEACGGVAP